MREERCTKAKAKARGEESDGEEEEEEEASTGCTLVSRRGNRSNGKEGNTERMKSSRENSIPHPLPQDVISTKKTPKVTSRKKKKKRREVNKGKSKKTPPFPPQQ
jgi:hypothetical protein